MKPNITAEAIDAILPQTQCGLCNYKGCMPYAEAIVKQEISINQCPPGGVKGLLELGDLVGIDPTPFIEEMEKKAKPTLLAVIREAECIGCAKCIKACPVDAILGGAKQMHTVIADECTGCELCVAPCPVDCIDMVEISDCNTGKSPKADHYRQRYQAHQKRLQGNHYSAASRTTVSEPQDLSEKKAYIQAALLRAKEKKSHPL